MGIRSTLILACLLASFPAGCRRSPAPADSRAAGVDAQVRTRWGKLLADLPVRKLIAISANNENIQNEFAWAFSLDHALAYGQRVDLEWRNVGGGGGQIGRNIENQYKRHDSAGIDVLWGGGDQIFRQLAKAGLLEPLDLPDDLLNDNVIPARFGGVELVDAKKLWAGSAVSGFGFLYNAQLLERFHIAPPEHWADLADPRFADLLVLTDPTQSGSAASAYRMIAQTGSTWPDGWGRLLRILANAKRFTNNAGSAANAPLVGESLAAACIDFYGLLRVAESGGQLVYVSPPGETVFTPDPIAILKNPPDGELARRFVAFVLSRRGQALLALGVGAPDGPVHSPLARLPIRNDVYSHYAPDLLPGLVNPYLAGQAMTLTPDKNDINNNVLRLLVRTAAVDNLPGLRAARDRLIATPHDAARLADFLALPPEADTLDAMTAAANKLSDAKFADDLATRWQAFFAQKYRRVARAN
ncbi:MAG: extracellular solute-binding protein [Planctomycetota bacterium]|nr:extracellular solute-binding protein [Planctomycetota bacterium]